MIVSSKVIIMILPFFLLQTSPEKLQKEIYLNYAAAIRNEGSTFGYFLVANIKNLNTGKVREVCTKSNFLLGALHREYGIGYSNRECRKVKQIALRNRERYFEFKSDSALQNLEIDSYTMEDLKAAERQINFDSLATVIRKTKNWAVAFENNDNLSIILYAHALFSRGILTGESSCFGGTLEYVDRRKPN